MALVPIAAILWRRLQQANFDSLEGLSKGQYDIRLGRDDDVATFFDGVPQIQKTSLGGYDLRVPIAEFDGTNPVQATELRVHFMGQRSERRDWNIPSQRPDTAYPLWRLNRVNPNRADENYDIIARDVLGRFHARWLNANAVAALPGGLQQDLRSKNFGVKFMAVTPRVQDAANIADKLRADHNVLLYGPPGTGKTQLMWEVARAFGMDPLQIDTTDETDPLKGGAAAQSPIVRWVTFHQSYGYEDFIVGLRPDPSMGQGLSLKAVPGVLLELAEESRATGRPALLLIDEINRGNVSRIFGEFITLLEPDKRLGSDGKETNKTISLTLPFVDADTVVNVDGQDRPVPNPFAMPASVYLLASMNSVDRSVAPLDAALRRRFRIVNLDPDVAALNAAFAGHPATGSTEEIAEVNRLRDVAGKVLLYLNEGISAFRGPDYQLGQWYLADMLKVTDLAGTRAALAGIWGEKLQPHLEDVFHGRAEQLVALAGDGGPIALADIPSQYESAGGRMFIRRRNLATDQILEFLTMLVRSTTATAATPDATVSPTAQTAVP
jgi:DNA polymerase III delta prime subunit